MRGLLRRVMTGLAAALWCGVGGRVFGQEAVSFEMRPPDDPPPGEPSIILGGTKAVAGRWPVTFVFNAAGGCTSTAVGKRTLLTAAHCFKGDTAGKIWLNHSDSMSVRCFVHSRYRPGEGTLASYDIALCHTAADIPLVQDKYYERVDLAAPGTRSAVRIVGWGCTEWTKNGALYEGGANTGGQMSGAWVDLGTGAKFCSGDSGGSVYQEHQATRSIVGIASRGDPTLAYFVTLSDQTIQTFLKQHEAEDPICGLSPEAVHCHG